MKIASSIILLICGVVALLGNFLPLVSYDGMSISIWEGIRDFGISDATDVLLIFIGSILLLVFSIPAVVIASNPEGSKTALLGLAILASIGAALGISGASWFLSDAIPNDGVELLSYGYYMSYAAAILGFIFGIIVSVCAATED